MEVTSVTCNKCGASLDVPPAARFVTCSYCGSQLEIKRTGSAVFTEVLDRLDQRTAVMADDLGALRRDSEIERLDREWTLRRDGLLVRNKDGSANPPSTTVGIVMIVVAVCFGLLWTAFASGMALFAHSFVPFPFSLFTSVFPCFGLLFIGVAIVGGTQMIKKAKTYAAEEREYLARRQKLLAETNASAAR